MDNTTNEQPLLTPDDKEELIRKRLVEVINKQPIFKAGLTAMGYYDRAVLYIPRMILFMLKHEEGIEILVGVGGYDFVRQFTDES